MQYMRMSKTIIKGAHLRILSVVASMKVLSDKTFLSLSLSLRKNISNRFSVVSS